MQHILGEDYCEVTLTYCDSNGIVKRKQHWLTARMDVHGCDFTVCINQPLTDFMEDFRNLVGQHFDRADDAGRILTCDVVHATFDKALVRWDWSFREDMRSPRLNDGLDTPIFKVNERTHEEQKGSKWFMAWELLRSAPVIHGVHHDLESSFWALLWIVLRHTKISMPADTWESVFPYGDDKRTRDAKRTWVGDDDEHEDEEQLVVVNNEPLTTLLFDLRALVRRNILKRKTWRFTYDVVLTLLHAAVEKQGWPADDRQEYTAPTTPVVFSLIAPQYDIPDSEAPHARGRSASTFRNTYHDQVLAAQHELSRSQPPCPLPVDHRYSVTQGVISLMEPKKRALEEDIPNDAAVAQLLAKPAAPRSKRPRIEIVTVHGSDGEVTVRDHDSAMNG
ncbi:hypothetical protein C8T65DRAFT_182825 [Cerioporus squamosus]|nr:hypothetical protein C8T65DRAFT_182825 [Cerioporus squamosus]